MNLIEVRPLTGDEEHRPIWSVMIPTYNCAQYVGETILSVLTQDRGINNMEIWIVEELGKGRVNFFKQKQNVGQLNNFGSCLNLTKGKIIHILHSDDFVHQGFYEKLVIPLLSCNNIGAAFTKNNIVDENSKLLFEADLLAPNAGVIDNFLSIITRKQVIQTPSIVVKREVYEKIGGFNRDLTGLKIGNCGYVLLVIMTFIMSHRLWRLIEFMATPILKTALVREDLLKIKMRLIALMFILSTYRCLQRTKKRLSTQPNKTLYVLPSIRQKQDYRR